MADDFRRVLTGEDFGAIRLTSLERLFGSQREAVATIVRGIHAVALKSHGARSARTPGVELDEDRLLALADEEYFERPHHAFVIDGERGSGKTTVLLTLYDYVKALRLDPSLCPDPTGPEDQIKRDLALLDLPAAPSDGRRRTALLLPIVFPETMEEYESAMEAVFAYMDRALLRELAVERDAARRLRLEKLQAFLRMRVGVSWTFSNRIGEQALQNDALSYEDYVLRRADMNRGAYTRITTWRYFVNAYLDELQYELLVLAFDDSDLEPRTADDILRSIRVYCSHPRIVTVMAVDMQTMQETALVHAASRRGEGIGGWYRGDGVRSRSAANVAANLDKVLPVALRQRLRSAADELDLFFNGSFTRYCKTRFDERKEALQADAVSWWLLAHGYRRLVDDTIRRLVTFHAGIESGGWDLDPLLLDYFKLRVLKDAVSGSLDNVPEAVEADDAVPPWVRRDQFDVGAADPLDPICAAMVEFWFDRELSMRGLDARAVPGLLHWLRLKIDDEGTLSTLDQERVFGVASLYLRQPVPRNCLYLFQFHSLSRAEREVTQEPSLWLGLLRAAREPVLGHDRPAEASLGDTADQMAGMDDGTALRWLRQQVALVARRPDIDLARIVQRAVEPQADPASVLTILYLFSIGRGRTRQDLVDGLRLDRLEDGARRSYFGRLAEIFAQAETEWRLAVRTWRNALKVARAATGKATKRDTGRLRSTPEASARSDLAKFTQMTDEWRALQGDTREYVLLSWSILPALDVLADFMPPAADGMLPWGEVLKLLSLAERAKKRPDDVFEPFDDFSPQNVALLRASIKDGAKRLRSRLEVARPAGGVAVEGGWPGDPVVAMAALLGTSTQWIERFGVVLT